MNKKGFTLIETLLVIALTAILLLILVPNVNTLIKTNDVKSCNNLKGSILSAAKIYVTENKYDLKFDDNPTQGFTIEKLIKTGALKLDSDELINPMDNNEIPRDTIVYVNYDENTDTFSYALNTIKCGGDDKIIYFISYNANGGTGGPSSQIKTQGEDLTLSSDEPSKEGDRFVCWNTKLDGNGTSYKPGDKYNSDENLDLYAQWNTQTYTVSYDANGGENVPDEQSVNYGTSLTISSGPTRVGYTFTGWNTKSDGNGKVYKSGDIYGENKDVTLYAQWEINEYTITYSANVQGEQNISGIPDKQTKKYNVNINLSNNMPTRIGYTFTGWNTDPDGGGISYKIGDVYSENKEITLYAQWEINVYVLTINSGKGGTIKVENTTRGVSVTVGSSASDLLDVYHGDIVKVSATASSDYRLYTLKYGTVSITNGSTYTVTSTETISATWDDVPSKPVITTIYDIWGSRNYTYSNYKSNVGVDGTWVSSGGDPQIKFDDITEFIGIKGAYVELDSALDKDINVQVFYATSSGAFNSTYRTVATLSKGSTKLMIPFTHGTESVWTKIRFDIGNESGISYKIKHLGVIANSGQWNRDNIILYGETIEEVSGVDYWQYTFNEDAISDNDSAYEGWRTFANSDSSKFVTPAYYIVRNGYTWLRVVDKGGNISERTEVPINIDEWVPAATIKVKDATTVTLSYEDNVSSGGLSYYFGTDDPSRNNVEYKNVESYSTNVTDTGISISGSMEKTVASAGTYYFSVKDVAGNVSEVKSINAYTINYDANGGSGAPASQIKLHGGDLTLSNDNPSRKGYKFVGWSTNKDANNYTWKAGDNYTINDNKTLYAIWSYTIKYYKNLNYIDNQNALLTTLDGVNFNKTNNGGALVGYLYNGYVSNFGGYNDRYTGVILLSENEDATKYYTSGSGTKDFEILDSITANGINYYYSSGWKKGDLKDTSGLVRVYEEFSDTGQGTFDETISLFINYILLKKELYSEVTVIGNREESLDINPDMTREGYTFLGWSKTPTGSILYNTTNNKVSDIGNTELYAIWKAKTLTITFNVNGGTGASPASQTFTYGVANNKFGYKVDGSNQYQWGSSGQFGTWDRTGYQLLGWNRNKDATTAQYGTYADVGNSWINTYSSEGVELYAIWKKK